MERRREKKHEMKRNRSNRRHLHGIPHTRLCSCNFFFIILFRILPAIVSQTANCEQTPRAEHSREVRWAAAGESAWIVCSWYPDRCRATCVVRVNVDSTMVVQYRTTKLPRDNVIVYNRLSDLTIDRELRAIIIHADCFRRHDRTTLLELVESAARTAERQG